MILAPFANRRHQPFGPKRGAIRSCAGLGRPRSWGRVGAGPTLRPALAIVLAALLLAAISAAPASASGLSRGDRDDAAALRRRHLALVRPARRRAHRAARRQRDADGDALGLHLADEHRRLPVEHARRARARPHRPPRGDRAAGAHAGHAGAMERGPERPVLQLVRPGHRRAPDHLAGRRLPLEPFLSASTTAGWPPRLRMVENGGPSCARRPHALRRRDGLRLLLRPGRGPAARRGVDRAAAGLQRTRRATCG